MKNYTVYIHVLPNKKKYIGITGKKPETRWNKGYGYFNNKKFYQDIIKFGWKNIKHEILFENLTKEEAEQKEIELIAKYQTTNEKYGYNIQKGGSSKGNISDKTRKLMSIKNPRIWLGKHLPKETREKISKSHKGKKLSKETIEKRNATRIQKGLMYATEEERHKARLESFKRYREKHREQIKAYNKKYQKAHNKFKDGEKRTLSEAHKRKLSEAHKKKNK